MIFLMMMSIALYFSFVAWLMDFTLDTYGRRLKGTILLLFGTITPLAIVLQIVYTLGK